MGVISEEKPQRRARRRSAVGAVLAEELVRDVAERLGRCGIDVMPVKGALLHKLVYVDPSERPLSDVDVLVRATDGTRAREVLTAAGYGPTERPWQFSTELRSPFELVLDLHTALFDQARYRFRTTDLFRRGHLDSGLFGARVVIQNPLDVYAHLVGKFASDHLDQFATYRLRELSLVSERLALEPDQTAIHLLKCGMRRAARYVLPLSRDVFRDRFAATVLGLLPPDRVGDALARFGQDVIARRSPHSPAGAVISHLLNDSVPRGVWSGVRAIARNARRTGVDAQAENA